MRDATGTSPKFDALIDSLYKILNKSGKFNFLFFFILWALIKLE